MIKKYSFFWNAVFVIMVAAGIVISPYIYFQWQEEKLLNTETEIPMEILDFEKIEHIQLSLEERRNMALEDNTDIERITLKTGNKYSLYEARKQCFNELSKLPILEMGIYSPPKKEIDIVPSLIVDSRSPAYSIIIWSGSLRINKIHYQIVLDEESGKLLSIQIANDNNSGNSQLQETLQEEWAKYFYNQ